MLRFFFCALVLSLSFTKCLSLVSGHCDSKSGPDGEHIWYSTTDFVPRQSISCGEMKLGHINQLSFDFVWNGPAVPGEPEMFFRVGFDSLYGTSCDGQSSNYPSFWVSGDDHLMIVVSDSESCSKRYTLSEYNAVTRFVSHHVEIYFDDDTLSVNISGGSKADYHRSWNKTHPLHHHIGQMAPVWIMSSKFGATDFNTANGTISAIVITARQFANFTADFTTEPTFDSTTELPFQSTFDDDAEDGPESEIVSILFVFMESDTVHIVAVVVLVLLCCVVMWCINQCCVRRSDVDDFTLKEAPKTSPSPTTSAVEPVGRLRLPALLEVEATDSFEKVFGPNGHRIFSNVGRVAMNTLSEFKSVSLVNSPSVPSPRVHGQSFLEEEEKCEVLVTVIDDDD